MMLKITSVALTVAVLATWGYETEGKHTSRVKHNSTSASSKRPRNHKTSGGMGQPLPIHPNSTASNHKTSSLPKHQNATTPRRPRIRITSGVMEQPLPIYSNATNNEWYRVRDTDRIWELLVQTNVPANLFVPVVSAYKMDLKKESRYIALQVPSCDACIGCLTEFTTNRNGTKPRVIRSQECYTPHGIHLELHYRMGKLPTYKLF